MSNAELLMTLDDAVAEVLGQLTGLDLTYDPELDRYRTITRQLNRALRSVATENEWSYYASTASVGTTSEGMQMVRLQSTLRPRIINDDAVRLVDSDGAVLKWAYFLPRNALHKYRNQSGLWCAITGQDLLFNRPLLEEEEGLGVQVPAMREPLMFRLPDIGETVPDNIRKQEVDFPYPDLVIGKAAYFYAQTDPVMQPRVQTLEANYKTLMYQLIERDVRNTDTPYINEYILPLDNGLISQTNITRTPKSNFT